MSDYAKKEWCRVCRGVTNHHYMDNVPSRHEYSLKCQDCETVTPEAKFNKIPVDTILDLREQLPELTVQTPDYFVRLDDTPNYWGGLRR